MATGEKTVGDVRVLSVSDVLSNCQDMFRYHMKSNLTRIVPMMIKKKIINKQLGKFIVQENDGDLLTSEMEDITLDRFIGYLEVMIELGSLEGPEGDTRTLMKIMTTSLEAMKPEPHSKLDTVIRKFYAAVFEGSTEQLQTDSSMHQGQTQITSTDLEEQVQAPETDVTALEEATNQPQQETVTTVISKRSITSSPPIRPPDGQIGDAVSEYFADKGGVLYSPIHGVSVSIPPGAIPADIKKYFLSMHFYLGQPFNLADNTVSCSVIVWFQHQPYFEFLEDVTVKIPHAATIDHSSDPNNQSLCVLTWGEDRRGPVYKLDAEVPADFSDGYHAVFRVKHFSPYGTARKCDEAKSSLELPLHKTMASTNRKKEKTKNRTSPVRVIKEEAALRMRYSMVCYMPSDRSGTEWEATFAACYNHPTGNWTLQLASKFGEELYGSHFDAKRTSFHACSGSLQLVPQEWSDGSCRVFATEASVLAIEDVESVPFYSSKLTFEKLISTKMYPPSVTYHVQRDLGPPSNPMRCRIEIQGAKTHNGSYPFFELISSQQSKAEAVLFTSSYLYGDSSDIVQALSNSTKDIVLDTKIPDHVKFLADVSLQLSDPTALSQALHLHGTKLVRINSECKYQGNISLVPYKLIVEWVSNQGRDAKLSILKTALSTIGFKDIALCQLSEDTDVLISSCFDGIPFPNLSSSVYTSRVDDKYTFVLNLSQMLQCYWWVVGSLMGIPLVHLEAAALTGESTPQYEMIYEWQRRHGVGATYGTLFKAIRCAYHHDSSHVNHAFWYATRFAEELVS